jgi:hypothetical protein
MLFWLAVIYCELRTNKESIKKLTGIFGAVFFEKKGPCALRTKAQLGKKLIWPPQSSLKIAA